MKLILMRHGQSVDDVGGLMQREDAPLTEESKIRLAKLREPMREHRFDTVYVSPFMRAKQTADIVFPDHPRVKILDFIHEYRRPKLLDGASREIGYNFWEVTHRENKFDPNWKIDGGESFNDVVARAERFANMLANDHGDEDKVCAVAHGNYFKHLLGHLILGKKYDTHFFHEFMRKIVLDNGKMINLELKKSSSGFEVLGVRFE